MLFRGVADHCQFVLCFWFFSQNPIRASSCSHLLLLLLFCLLANRNGGLHFGYNFVNFA